MGLVLGCEEKRLWGWGMGILSRSPIESPNYSIFLSHNSVDFLEVFITY
jgi:hypothetical protein